jgi:hypothetical protein
LHFVLELGNLKEITFYINCGIYCKNIELKLDNNILEMPKIADCHYNKRIENIIKNGAESYKINKDVDIKLFGEKIIKDLKLVIDFYNNYNNIEDILFLIVNENGLNQYEKIFTYFKIMNDNNFIEMYKENINNLLKNDRRKEFFDGEIRKIILK